MRMRGKHAGIIVAFLALAGLDSALDPRTASGQCASEVNAVMLVSGIYPGTSPQITLLHIARVAAQTNPTAEELLAAVEAVYTDYPVASLFLIDTLGDYDLFFAAAGDFGSATVVDNRTAEVLFAGTIIWMGTGEVVVPSSATHDAPLVPGDPAPPPTSVTAFPNAYWEYVWGAAEELAQAGVALAAQTDFLRGMAACGDYAVVGFTYTPTVGLTNPSRAVEVLIFSGRLDESWIPVASEQHSWGEVKALYR